MANDALLLNIPEIRFDFVKKVRMKVYAIGVAADNLGKVIVTMPPAVTPITHLPKLEPPPARQYGILAATDIQFTSELAASKRSISSLLTCSSSKTIRESVKSVKSSKRSAATNRSRERRRPRATGSRQAAAASSRYRPQWA